MSSGIASPTCVGVIEETAIYVPKQLDNEAAHPKSQIQLNLPHELQELLKKSDPEENIELKEWIVRVEKKVLGRTSPEDEQARRDRIDRRRSINQSRKAEREEVRKEKNRWIKVVMKKKSSTEMETDKEKRKLERRDERHRRKACRESKRRFRDDDGEEHTNHQLMKDAQLFEKKGKSIKEMRALFQQKMEEAAATKTSTIVPTEIPVGNVSTPKSASTPSSTPRSDTTPRHTFGEIMGARKTPTNASAPQKSHSRTPSKQMGNVNAAAMGAIDVTTVKKESYVKKTSTFRM
jgi:hypothetical protein